MREFKIVNKKNGFTQTVREDDWNNPRKWPEDSRRRFRIVSEVQAAQPIPMKLQKPVVQVPKEVKEASDKLKERP